MLHLVIIFIAVFIFSVHFAATLYINSSFLEHFFSLKAVGLLYVAGSLTNILLFIRAPKLLNHWGVRKFLFVFLWLTLFATLGAAYAFSPLDAGILFIIYAASSPMVYYALDLVLEERSPNRITGEIRGVYLTLINTAIAIGPLLITVIGTDDMFRSFYIAAAIVLIPLVVLAYFFLWPKHKPSYYSSHELPLREWFRRKKVMRVTSARWCLEFFYALMTIYTPIYLHSNIGFNWTEIGVILSIVLLPFILFEYPAGELADKKYGEREIMSLGFLITLSALLFLPLLEKNIILWIALLFISRIGAAFIEITTESYFFKQISAEDSGLISIFRLARSMGLIIGAGIGALTLSFYPFKSIFIILALVCFLGWRVSRKLVDTK